MKNRLIAFFVMLGIGAPVLGMDPNVPFAQAFNQKTIGPDILKYLRNGADFDSLTAAGIDINTTDKDKNDTILHIICAFGAINTLNNLLTSFRPDPTIKNNNGATAIELAQCTIDKNQQRIREIEEEIRPMREEHEKLIGGMDSFAKKKSPDDKTFHETSNKIKKEFIEKYNASIAKQTKEINQRQRTIDKYTNLCNTLSRYTHYYEAGIPTRFNLTESASERLLISLIPKLKNFCMAMSVTGGVVFISALIPIVMKYKAASRVSSLKNYLFKTKTILLNIDFDIHNAEVLFKPADELFDIESFAKTDEQYEKLTAAVARFDELVLVLYERIRDKYFYHPASYFIEQESVLIDELEEVHATILTLLDDGQKKTTFKKPFLTLLGSAVVGACAWWFYKNAHPLKRWGIF